MWQRIQTIFLLLVIISMAMMLFLPIWEKTLETGESLKLTPFHTQITDQEGIVVQAYFPYIFIGILAIFAVIVAFFEITRYKNRLTQMKLGALNSLIMAVVLGLSVYFMISAQQDWNPETEGSYKPGLFMPALGMIFNMMANRFIRRDEKLVRSVDRIR